MRRSLRFLFQSLLLLAALLMGGILLFRNHYGRNIRQLAKMQIQNKVSELIHDIVSEQLGAGTIRYDRIISFEKDFSGRITALETNIGEVNRLKTDILNLINDEILANAAALPGISLGSVMLPEFWAGHGPTIPIRILSVRSSDSNFTGSFQEVGISQTRHQLTMDIRIDLSVRIFGEVSCISVSNRAVLAEAIIVGEVPQFYWNNGGQYGSKRENKAAD